MDKWNDKSPEIWKKPLVKDRKKMPPDWWHFIFLFFDCMFGRESFMPRQCC